MTKVEDIERIRWAHFREGVSVRELAWRLRKSRNTIRRALRGAGPWEYRVRLRTNSTKRLRARENALYLVFKLVLRLSTNWRPINGRNQLALLLDGEHFDDGRLRRTPTTMEGTGA